MAHTSGSFELIVLGCSGGPLSGKTCAFLLKPAHVSFEQILKEQQSHLIALDAGSGLETVADIVADCRNNTNNVSSYLTGLYPDSEPLHHYSDISSLTTARPFNSAVLQLNKSNLELARAIISKISAYFITHAHLDHIAGLVINSPGFSGSTKVHGSEETIDTLKNHIFNGKVWPDLDYIQYKAFPSTPAFQKVGQAMHLKAYPTSHGLIHSKFRYKSAAFLIREDTKDDHILVFGDVESDPSSNTNYIEQIWSDVAELVLSKQLRTIVIECSSVDKAPSEPLFGHMSPLNLIKEFSQLSKICSQKNPTTKHPLQGINVLIIHVKETFDGTGDPRKKILNKLRQLNLEHDLGLHFTMCMPGLSYII
ncbi:hypothetical protein OGAPHI_003735 [Ogataea philodendri]|uniref:3',5'-cyclic-nucleotide phosphodiesterase n=1 Tax=Ogataea philodendri TaxID=1378263 RepID=A0A9P8P6H4_9ASCO|nr:uncharacterized protein OGAPHI_003735 [Ogataea philodendri]KAH3665549.1 hypothetical protein OGAPHI_003735 [Ogataea philodendri]